MSFQYPPSNPSLSSQQPLENNHWRSPGPKLGGYGLSQSPGISNNLNTFFRDRRTLPMYKDKPYFAPRRTGPRVRHRRVLYSGLCLFFLILLWYYMSGWGSAELPISESRKGEELWAWVQSLEKEPFYNGKELKGIDWVARREKVRDVFIVSWDDYAKNGWGLDEYHPIAKNGKNMVEGGLGWIIVDALDTMILMNLTSRVQDARSWIHHSLQYNQDHDVNTFETTIRMLGGLLSAHYLSTSYPTLAPVSGDVDLYIEKATDLAERLAGAFDSNSGVPYASINLKKSEGIAAHSDNGASSTSEATTVQLEFKYLAKLTGEAAYWRMVEKVMQVVDDSKMEDGLVPIYIYPETGKFRGNNIRLGSRGDSYYEYLIKQYLQTSEQEPVYKEMWDEALMGIRKHLITYTKRAKLTVLGERPSGLERDLVPKMDHLACFLPGTIALGATGGVPLSQAKKSPNWSQRHDEEILLAEELMKTCWATYLVTKTGLAPEITYFNLDETPVMMKDMYPGSTLNTDNRKSQQEELPLKSKPLYPLDDDTLNWENDIDIKMQDRHNLQRPETVESLMYMYRITGDETYRHWGWEMFKSFARHTAIVEHADHHPDPKTDKPVKQDPSQIISFTSLNNVNSIPPARRDNLESFWMAETLKYFYLLFSDRDFIPLEDNVFNTEAHPFPKFELGGDLKTGWKRKSREPELAPESAPQSQQQVQ
ncbi:glycoside hydrolase [Aspergillus coremiiformis]|uniref:alpha-1,2-Mannosidase n=1 Tax=Aspergillus coremiiformis TaxID=138285 RepID=A0A5N6YV02_9EURO|nr:glycoside hydrolase [Aspergillus coremiiformis]